MSEPKRVSPLKTHWVGVVPARLKSDSLVISEAPFLGKILLQGETRDRSFIDPAGLALGFPLPRIPNTSARKGILSLWLSPSAWLLVTDEGGEAAVIETLRKATEAAHAAVTDVSDSYVALHVEGSRARTLLAKGVSLDLHPRVFEPRRCARTLLAGAPVILYLSDDGARFEIFAESSYADYIWVWLNAAAAEFLGD